MSTLVLTDSVSLAVAVRRFTVHFLEMCVVMCAGGVALDAAVFGAASALGTDLVAAAPGVAIMVIAFDATIAMAVYMYLRHHPMRHTVEMSASTVIGGVALLAALALGWIPAASLTTWLRLTTFMCGPLCVLMFVVMVVRFEHYGGRVGATVAPGARAAAGAYACPMHPEVRRAGPGTCPLCGMTLIRAS